MKLIKKILKWSAIGGAIGGAYGLGVTHTLKSTKPVKKPFYRRYGGRK